MTWTDARCAERRHGGGGIAQLDRPDPSACAALLAPATRGAFRSSSTARGDAQPRRERSPSATPSSRGASPDCADADVSAGCGARARRAASSAARRSRRAPRSDRSRRRAARGARRRARGRVDGRAPGPRGGGGGQGSRPAESPAGPSTRPAEERRCRRLALASRGMTTARSDALAAMKVRRRWPSQRGGAAERRPLNYYDIRRAASACGAPAAAHVVARERRRVAVVVGLLRARWT